MFRQPSRRRFLTATLTCLAGGAALPAWGEGTKPPFTFYAMDTALAGPDVPTLEKKVRLLKELGFAGIGYTLDHRRLPHLLELLDREGLELWAVYTTPSLEGEPDPELA